MDRKKLVIGAVIVVILALGGGVAVAAQQHEDPRVDRAAEEAALSAVPGEVKETELEREDGSTIYEVEVAGTDGNLREVAVDAGNGQVLDQEIEEEEFFEKDDGSENEGPEYAE